MFDHIIHTPRVRKKVVKIRHHVSVFAIVAGVIGSVVALNLNLPSFQTISISQASVTAASLRLIGDNQPVSAVGPLQLWPLATIEAKIADSLVHFDTVQFRLNGIYNDSSLQGITLYIDNVQAGVPVLPDADHMVRFKLETVALAKGAHTMSVKITTNDSSASSFQASFDPYTGVITTTGQVVRMQLPYQSAIVTVASHGDIGSFVRTNDEVRQLYLYGIAEDFHLEHLHIVASEDMSGTRIDILQGGQFLATGVFAKTEADIDMRDVSPLVLRDKNLILSLNVIPQLQKNASMTLDGIQASGVVSQQELVFSPHLQLLP